MTDTATSTLASNDSADSSATAKKKRGSGLSSMLLPELRSLAGELGIPGASGMRKGDLVAAIESRQTTSSPRREARSEKPAKADAPASTESAAPADNSAPAASDSDKPASSERPPRQNRNDRQRDRGDRDNSQRDNSQRENRDNNRDNRGDRDNNQQRDNQRDNNNQRNDRNNDRNNDNDGDDGNDRNGRRRRRGRDRYRDRERPARRNDGDNTEISEDDVLLPVAGIVDILDNYAFVRTSGYLPGPSDVYVSLGMVRKSNLRKGDAITGAVRQTRDGENQGNQSQNRQKFNALVRIDTINGMDLESARNRVDFGKLTPLYPQDRLRLEVEPNNLTTRVIDLVAPIGKGQRGLIVSPPKAGKTMVLQAIANAITTNDPDVHLMVVLVDERPEEVTDMQRSVKGEVIASTFDRPAEDHTTVAELAIERAKRLVELGHDVVVLLDSITRLGRAYNLAAPTSGRILSGGVDSSALYPPKRFFGAARNIEEGGSLTIVGTCLVDTGSRMDDVIYEEFKGTGNSELILDRKLAEKRIFPAIDVQRSGTRREELLLEEPVLKMVWTMRRMLSAVGTNEGIELLLNRLSKTDNNVSFLATLTKSLDQ